LQIGESSAQRIPFVALAALGVANMLLALDLSALNVVLPRIERGLDVDLRAAQWVVNAYLLVYGMTIVTGGRLADELGRRRIFIVGGGLFGAMSLLCGLAPSIEWLIGARAVMGIGSGLMLPSIVGMAYAIVPPQRAALAGGFVIGAYGVGMAFGPMLGGGLTELLGWRWTQFVNVPIAVLALLAVWRTVPAPGVTAGRTRIDYPGIVTLSAALVALLLAIDQVGVWGWGDWRIRLALAIATALLAVFVLVERRAGEAALIPGDVVRVRGIAVACVLKVLFAPAYSATLLFLPQIMQKLLRFSPLETGFGMVPMLGAYAVVSFAVGALGRRLAVRVGIIAGLVGVAGGTFLVSSFDAAAGFLALIPGMVLIGIGLGLFQPSITTDAVAADARGRKSLVSGLTFMFQYVGGAIGLGLTTAVVASSERSAVDAAVTTTGTSLAASERAALDRMLSGAESAQAVLTQFGPDVADQLTAAAGDAFAAGIRAGLRLDAMIAAVGLVLAVLALGRMRPTEKGTALPAADRSAAPEPS
jgi:EmrB/QacA subfamily drug resistance transporter